MDYLLIVLVAVLAFLVGYFVCQKMGNKSENFTAFDPSQDMDQDEYASMNKDLMNDDSEPEPEDQDNEDIQESFGNFSLFNSDKHEMTRMKKMMELNGEEEQNNIESFGFGSNYAPVNDEE